MLALQETRSLPYTPLPGRPPLPVPPNRVFEATAEDGARFEVFVVGSLFTQGPWMLELRVHGAELGLPGSVAQLREPARWPTVDELFTIVDQAFPRGMPVMVPLMSNGVGHKYTNPEPDAPRQLFLNGIAVQAAPQQQRGPVIVGGRA